MNKVCHLHFLSSFSDAAPACVPPAFCCELVGKNPSSSLVGKASKMHFTKCWCPLCSRRREMHVRLHSSKASLEPSVPRFLWRFFSLSCDTFRDASSEFLVQAPCAVPELFFCLLQPCTLEGFLGSLATHVFFSYRSGVCKPLEISCDWRKVLVP